MIGLIDCNNFYVSCERAFQPRLEGVPVGVLSNNDGCVIARSNETQGAGRGDGHAGLRAAAAAASAAIRCCRRTTSSMATCPPGCSRCWRSSPPGWSPTPSTRCSCASTASPRADAPHAQSCSPRYGASPYPGLRGRCADPHPGQAGQPGGQEDAGYGGVCVLSRRQPETSRGCCSAGELGDVWGVGRRLVERLALMGIQARVGPGPGRPQGDPRASRSPWSAPPGAAGIPCIEMNDPTSPPAHHDLALLRQADRQPEEIHEALRQFGQRSAEKLRAQDSLARPSTYSSRPTGTGLTCRNTRRAPWWSCPAPPTTAARSCMPPARPSHAIYRPHYRFMKAA
jgi:DNA polymerase V